MDDVLEADHSLEGLVEGEDDEDEGEEEEEEEEKERYLCDMNILTLIRVQQQDKVTCKMKKRCSRRCQRL